MIQKKFFPKINKISLKQFTCIVFVFYSLNYLFSQNTCYNCHSQAKNQFSKYNREKEMYENSLSPALKALEWVADALKLDSNDKEAKKLGFEINYQIGNDFLNKGKQKLRKYYNQGLKRDMYSDWYDGYYFYGSLEYFANALPYCDDSSLIINRIVEIDSIGQLATENNFTHFSINNLHKISTSNQKETIGQIKKIKTILKNDKYKLQNTALLEYYTQLVNLEKYHFEGCKLQSYDYREARIEKAKLDIELGKVNEGCEELYYVDVLNYMFSYNCPKGCENWKKEYEKKRDIKYISEEKEKAKQWNIKNPNKVKFSSLFGESYTVVESYFGLPIQKQYKIDLGSGLNSNQYVGNKYKSKNGYYEIGFYNGNIVLIKFTPSIALPFSVENMEYGSNKTKIDFESNFMNGACSINEDKGYIGSIQTFSINFECTQSTGYIEYFGLNGKVLYVVGYFFR